MTTQQTCRCCRQSAQIVDKNGLCFTCNTFQTFATIIEEHTDLTDEESLDLAGELQEAILSAIIDRLQLPGHDHPLAAELLQTMELRERPH
jgi:hypothetical protein